MACDHKWMCVSAYEDPESWCSKCGALRDDTLGDVTEPDVTELARDLVDGAVLENFGAYYSVRYEDLRALRDVLGMPKARGEKT